VLGVVASFLLIDESRDDSHEQRPDISGLLASGLGLFALTYGLIEANNFGWTSGRILGSFAAAAVLLTAFVLVELHQRLPMMDLSLFKNGTFAGANLAMLLVALSMFGVFFFVSLYMQNILGFSAVQAGAAFLPMTLLVMIVAPVAGRLSDRFGSRWLITTGLSLLSIQLFYYSTLGTVANFWNLLPGMIVGGFGMSLAMTPTAAAVLRAVPTAKAGVGSATLNSMRQVGGALGIALMGAIVGHVSGGVQTPEAFVDGFSTALRVAGLIALAGAVVAAALVRQERHDVPVTAPGPA
jgi:predicted MFS family arabinose efflux permease